MVRQCPRCELRFRDDAEVKWHLEADHGVDRDLLERPVQTGDAAPLSDEPPPRPPERS